MFVRRDQKKPKRGRGWTLKNNNLKAGKFEGKNLLNEEQKKLLTEKLINCFSDGPT